jgi:lactate dehydrogenase-like 2-hydroxyacid dehydrogenase
MTEILVTGPLPSAAAARLDGSTAWFYPGPETMPASELAGRAAHATGLLCFLGDRIDRRLIANSPDLKVISQVAVGVDNIDLAAATGQGIPVGHTPDVLTDTTADTALALLLAVLRRLPEGWSLVREGRWKQWSLDLLIGGDLHHTTAGIVGLGRIGTAVGRRLQGFETALIYTGPSPKPEVAEPLGAQYLSLSDLLARSDHVILTAPLRDSTHHMIGAAELALMKPGSTLINVARGGLVDTIALVEALRSGPLGRAGLDVTDPEPLPPGHPLAELDNCLVIPHLGSASERTRLAMANLAIDNLLAGMAGERLFACANPEVYDGV